MNDYEIMLLLDPEIAETRANDIIQRIRDSVDGAEGRWDGHEPWGRRRLAFEIDHKIEAIYHLLLFTAPAETLAEITRVLKISDGVLRHGAYRRVKGSQHQKAPSQPAAAPPAAERGPSERGSSERGSSERGSSERGSAERGSAPAAPAQPAAAPVAAAAPAAADSAAPADDTDGTAE